MEELKPCPFCGEKPELIKSDATRDRNYMYHVYCKGCGVDMWTTKHEDSYKITAKEAVDAWNKRTFKMDDKFTTTTGYHTGYVK